MKSILITRPSYDEVTEYLSAYAGEMIGLAKRENVDVINLSGNRANRKNVENVLRKRSPKLVFINGHGNDKEVCGHHGEFLIKSELNEDLLNSKIAYVVACSSAERLGPDCVNKGTLAYIGYEEEFMICINKNKSIKPLNDDFAKPIFEVSNQVVASLLCGETVRNACFKSRSIAERWIEKLRGSKSPEAPFILQAIVWNMLFQKTIGNLDASV